MMSPVRTTTKPAPLESEMASTPVISPAAVMDALRSYRDMVCQTVLSDTLADGAADGAETRDIDLNGQQAKVSLRKAD